MHPAGLCKAIVRGITRQLEPIGTIEAGVVGPHAATDEKQNMAQLKMSENGYSCKYKDDISGQLLRDDLAAAARVAELEYFNSKGVWRKKTTQEAYLRTGRPPIPVRRADVNKGDRLNPRRSRLVARQPKATDKSGASYFAPSPPPDALRTVLYSATTIIGFRKPCYDESSPRCMQMGLLDIPRASLPD